MRRTIVALAALLSAFGPASALARTETAGASGVTATFSYSGGFGSYHGETLTISRAGAVLYRQPVVAQLCGRRCAPGAPSTRARSVHVLDLEGNGSPDVVLDLFSGGAHCCFIEQVFSFDAAAGRYLKTERNFGDPGAEIRFIGSRYVFLTADDTFAYAFTDYAASGFPIQILQFSNRRFDDVTRSFPKLVAADAREWLRLFYRMASDRYADSAGVAAAWAADEELLGHGRRVAAFLHRQAKAGHLNSALIPSLRGERFVRALYRLLRRDGYLTSRASASAARACRTAELGGRLILGSPGAGQRYATLELFNRSTHACHTYGWVGLLLLDRRGRALATRVVRDPSAARRVVLAPGAFARAQLHWTAIPGLHDRGGPCLTPPQRIEITPPDQRSHLTLRWRGGVVCGGGRIDVTALARG